MNRANAASELGNALLESSDELRSRRSTPRQVIWLIALGLLALPSTAHASLFHGETLDAIANGISWVVLIIAPIIGIAVFWLVHILPEKIAEKKNHPQTQGDPVPVPALALLWWTALANRMALGLLPSRSCTRWLTAPMWTNRSATWQRRWRRTHD